jgi:hypothetical protein
VLRILFTLLAALSLLLCLASAALWVRSYYVDEIVMRSHASGAFEKGEPTFESTGGYYVTHSDHLISNRRETWFDSTCGYVVLRDRWHTESEEASSPQGVRKLGADPVAAENEQRSGFDSGARYDAGEIPARRMTVNLSQLPQWVTPDQRAFEYHAIGFALEFHDNREIETSFRDRNLWVAVPWPAIVLLTALPLPLWVYRFRKRRRLVAIMNNLCIRCGYSLVGNVSGICPE